MADVDKSEVSAGDVDNSPVYDDPDKLLENFQAQFGQMGENLPTELQEGLKECVKLAEWQNRTARLEEIRKIQRRHEYFKGNQNIYWDGLDKRWKPISTSGGVNTRSDDAEELQKYDYVTNIYGQNCIIDMAVMTQNPPRYGFAPADPSNSSDVASARAAKDVAEFIRDNNKLDLKQLDLAFLFYNDGGCGSYTRWEVDGKKYGFKNQPITQPMPAKLTPDQSVCPNCGDSQDLPDGQQPGPACAQCAQPMGPQDMKPGMMGIVPKTVGVKKVPNGQEVISYIGYMELERPFWAKGQDDFPWLKWETEVPKSKLRALYPGFWSDAADGDAGDEGADDYPGQPARVSRISLAATSYGRTVTEGAWSLITYRRVWLRPWFFFELDNKTLGQKLYKMFPTGAFVATAGTRYLESRPEDMDDHWVIGHAMPGDGQVRECLGEWMVDVQRRFNNEQNIMTETFERNISVRIMDPEVVDIDAYWDGGSTPGATMPGTPRPGMALGDAVYDTPPANVSPQMVEHANQLMGQISQFLTANQPQVFGGSTGSNDTARGIAMVKDSSLGIKSIFKIPQNELHSRTMLNAIKLFKRYRDDDVALAVEQNDGQFDSQIISIQDLDGNIRVKMDVNAAYPTTVAQRREIAMNMMQNPQIAQALGLMTPEGIIMLRELLGTGDFNPPGFDARMHQMRETRQLLQGVAVPVNEMLDEHDQHIAQIKDWWESNEGQLAAQTNPDAIQLVLQHLQQHLIASGMISGALDANGQPIQQAQGQPQPAQGAPQGQ
jgi:hypothetical protein